MAENKNKLYLLVEPNLVSYDKVMTEEAVYNFAYELAFESLSKYTAEKEMSEFIKGNFDREFEPEWQCVIGKDFSVAFSHEIENFVFFQIEDCYFLFYKL